MRDEDPVLTLLRSPEIIGREVGFRDLRPIHGLWIRLKVH